jgi:hypothetical protein
MTSVPVMLCTWRSKYDPKRRRRGATVAEGRPGLTNVRSCHTRYYDCDVHHLGVK